MPTKLLPTQCGRRPQHSRPRQNNMGAAMHPSAGAPNTRRTVIQPGRQRTRTQPTRRTCIYRSPDQTPSAEINGNAPPGGRTLAAAATRGERATWTTPNPNQPRRKKRRTREPKISSKKRCQGSKERNASADTTVPSTVCRNRTGQPIQTTRYCSKQKSR